MIEKVTKLVKDVDDNSLLNKTYDDLFHPTTSLLGTTIYGIVKLALAPVRGLVWSSENIEEWMYTKVSSYLEKIPEENIITPDPLIAVPLIQQVRISGNHEHLKELYAKLLAKSMDKEHAGKILPSYVEIIKQLTSLDVKLLEILIDLPGNKMKVVDLEIKKGKGTLPFFVNLTELKIDSQRNITVAIYNLDRLRLAEIPYGVHISPSEKYNVFKSSKEYKLIEDVVKSDLAYKGIQVRNKQLRLTAFGIEFINVCK